MTYEAKHYHRVEADDPQFSLHIEEMMREFGGQVSGAGLNLTFTPSDSLASPIFGIEEAKEILNEIGERNKDQPSSQTWFHIYNEKLTTYYLTAPRLALVLRCVYFDGDQSRLKEVRVTIYSPNADDISRTCLEKLNKFGFSIPNVVTKRENKVGIDFAFVGGGGKIVFKHGELEKAPFSSIEQNYSNEVILKVKKTIETIKTAKHGLIILNGPPGTGKTHLIKALLSEMAEERQGVTCSPAQFFLGQAGNLAEVATQFPKSILVFDDIGDVLQPDAAIANVDARANILNFSDGLFSILEDTILILTFNFDVNKIDPAFLRPGRCLSHIVVEALPYEKAIPLLSEHLRPLLPKREYALAEIYEINRSGVIPANGKEKIGFAGMK